MELNTNAHTKVNIFHNLYTTTPIRHINTNITNNTSSYNSTLIKEGYTTSGSTLDLNPYSSIAKSTDLAGQAKENEHMHPQQIQQENMLGVK